MLVIRCGNCFVEILLLFCLVSLCDLFSLKYNICFILFGLSGKK